MRDPRSTWVGDEPTAEGDARPPDRYEIRAEIGRGGMGRVYAAWDPVLGREVALKVMVAARATEDFLREARLAARLEHPAIVPVHDAGVSEAGEPWYAMRLVRGRTLRDAIAEPHDPPERRLELLDAVIDVARALAHAHDRGVVHRDLKPDNVLVGPWGEVQLVDWGLGHALAEADPFLGRRVGTPAWMSPEQRRGERADPRADVFALGLLLRAVVLGGAPWEEPGRAPTPLPAWCPAELAAIVARATSEAPADRYRHAGALADDLLAFRAGRRVSAHAYSFADELRRVNARFWWPIRFAVGVLAAGVGAFGLVVAQVRTARRAEAEAEAALTRSLLQAAVEADRAERGVEALSFAAEALVRREDPVARGIVARWLTNLPVALAAVGDAVPGPCTAAAVDGDLLVCSGPNLVWAARGLSVLWSAPADGDSVRHVDADWVVSGDPQRLVLRRAADGQEVGRTEPGLRAAVRFGDHLRIARGRRIEDRSVPDLALLRAWEAPTSPVSVDPFPSPGFWGADGLHYALSDGGMEIDLASEPRSSIAYLGRGPASAAGVRLEGSAFDLDPATGRLRDYPALPFAPRRAGMVDGVRGWVSDGVSTVLLNARSASAGSSFPAAGGPWLAPGSAPGRVRGVLGEHLVEWRAAPTTDGWGGVRKLTPTADGALVVSSTLGSAVVDPATGERREEGPPLSPVGPPDAVRLGPGSWVYADEGGRLMQWSPGAGSVPTGDALVLRLANFGPGGYAFARRDALVRRPAGGPELAEVAPRSANVELFGSATAARTVVAREAAWWAAEGSDPARPLGDGTPLGRPDCGLWAGRDGVARRLDAPGVLAAPPDTLELCDLGEGRIARFDAAGATVARGDRTLARIRLELPSDLARAGDWLALGTWDGALLRIRTSVFDADAAALREEARRVTGWRVAGGALVADPDPTR